MSRLIGAAAGLCRVKPPSLPSFATNARAAGDRSTEYEINAKGITVKLSANGEIAGAITGGRDYLAYGPLLDAMRGKKWVLAPYCLEVVDGAAKGNLFQVPGGYAMAVCFGGKAEFAKVVIKNIPGLDAVEYSVIHPGVETIVSATILSKDKDGATRLRIPLLRGCAMVTLRR